MLGSKKEEFVVSPMKFVYYEGVLTVVFNVCSRSAEGARQRGHDRRKHFLENDVLTVWLAEMEEIEKKLQKNK